METKMYLSCYFINKSCGEEAHWAMSFVIRSRKINKCGVLHNSLFYTIAHNRPRVQSEARKHELITLMHSVKSNAVNHMIKINSLRILDSMGIQAQLSSSA
jgi:hypothetical protein